MVINYKKRYEYLNYNFLLYQSIVYYQNMHFRYYNVHIIINGISISEIIMLKRFPLNNE